MRVGRLPSAQSFHLHFIPPSSSPSSISFFSSSLLLPLLLFLLLSSPLVLLFFLLLFLLLFIHRSGFNCSTTARLISFSFVTCRDLSYLFPTIHFFFLLFFLLFLILYLLLRTSVRCAKVGHGRTQRSCTARSEGVPSKREVAKRGVSD